MARIGLMGCGSVADFGHLPAIVRTPGLELVALFDPDAGRVASTAAKFGVAGAFTDPERFFESGLDGVVVASSAPAHRENVLMAAAHGVHVLCEKPLSHDPADGEGMIAAMSAANRHLLVGFVYRFSPVAQQIKRWVDEGIVGEIRSLRLSYVWDLHGRYEQNAEGNWIESPRWRGRMLEGGPMVDCGVHQVDLALWWLGDEVVRTAAAGAWVADYEAPDHMYLHLDHAKGAHSMVEMAFTYGHTARNPAPIFTYDLIGTGGFIRYNRDGWRIEAHTGEEVVVAPGASEKNFEGMHAAFAQVLATGDVGGFPTARDGVVATKIARDATDDVIRNRLAATTAP